VTNKEQYGQEASQLAKFKPSQYSRERATLCEIICGKVWRIVNITLYRFSPSGARGWRRFLVRLFGGKASGKSSLSRSAIIDCPWNFSIGEYSSIGDKSWVYALERIQIGDKVCVGESVKLLTGTHDIESANFALVRKPVIICSGCWVATSATVLPGITVNEGAVVGACAVVTKDVEPWTVVVGNPAKVIKKRVIRNG